MQHGTAEEPTLLSLNKDCLESIYAHLDAVEVLDVRQTCSINRDLLSTSVNVWAKLLKQKFELPVTSQAPLMQFTKQVFETSKHSRLRFQGVFTNGGVDEDAMQYWVDNIFKVNRTPYCSNASNNIDNIALLLDGNVPRDERYATCRQYMMVRCRYAAALVENVHHNNADLKDSEQMMHIVEGWSEQHLEQFFTSLVDALREGDALGRMLLYDVPFARQQMETQALYSVHSYILNRPGLVRKDIIKPEGERDICFDASVVEKLASHGQIDTNLPPIAEAATATDSAGILNNSKVVQHPLPTRHVGIVHQLNLSRAGSLTCPVASGVVFIGRVNYEALADQTAEHVMTVLQEAAHDPAVVAFNSQCSREDIENGVANGVLPPIVATEVGTAGSWIEFGGSSGSVDVSSQQADVGSKGKSPVAAAGKKNKEAADAAQIVTWRPLVWFSFNPAPPVEDDGQQPADVEMADAAAAVEEQVVVANTATPQQPEPATDNQAGPSTSNQHHHQHPNTAQQAAANDNDLDENGNYSNDNSGDDDEDDDDEDWADGVDPVDALMLGPDRTAGRNQLHVELHQPVAGNIMLVKLINQENLMDELQDLYPYPNIDMTYCEVIGKMVQLPDGVKLVV